MIDEQLRAISKGKKYQNTPVEDLNIAAGGGQMAPAAPKYKHNVKMKVNGPTEDDGVDDDPIDVWAALEEACAQLGWSLEQIQAMLEDTDNFPSKEILDIIMSSTGCDDAARIKSMLIPQRTKVLEKVKMYVIIITLIIFMIIIIIIIIIQEY